MTVRRSTIEHVFGTLKHWMGWTHFRIRGLQHVSAEMSLHVLAYNFRRLIKLLGIASIEMAGTGEPTQHPSPPPAAALRRHPLASRGGLGELDLTVGAGNEHSVDYPALEVDMRIQRAAEALRAKLTAAIRRWRILRRGQACS
jgi:hypothetical protein